MAPNPAPQLDELEKKVLAAVLERSLIGGAELTHRVDLDDPNQLIAVVRKLQAQDLIEVSGDVLNETRFPYAMIGIRPSAKEYLYSILKQQV